jgi:hypothetical protein
MSSDTSDHAKASPGRCRSSLRTTNPIESTFATRQEITKRKRSLSWHRVKTRRFHKVLMTIPIVVCSGLQRRSRRVGLDLSVAGT